MAASPIHEELAGQGFPALFADLANESALERVRHLNSTALSDTSPRKLAIYPGSAGFELVEELDFLAARSVEPNIFFNPRFLAPAMPRLGDREVFLSVMRDETEDRSRLRFLLPYTIERPGLGIGPSIIRSWSSPFGPSGTPLIDIDDPVGTVEDFFELLTRPSLGLPSVLVLPDIPVHGEAASVIRTAAMGKNLTVITSDIAERAILASKADGEDYLRDAISAHHFRGFRRLKRRLSAMGDLVYEVARQSDDVRRACEAFLTLELMGWKGRDRSAMASDRYQAAFAREAVYRLAQQDKVRIHTLTLDENVIAANIVLVDRGVAYTWKTTYDEALSRFSPGTLLMIETTCHHLDDPNIMFTDSCALPDHPVMNRLWSERRQLGTLIVGLRPDADKAARHTATQLHLYRETRNTAKKVYGRMRSLVRSGH